MDDDETFECDLCGRSVSTIYECESCMSSRCEDCHRVHGCNCPTYVLG